MCGLYKDEVDGKKRKRTVLFLLRFETPVEPSAPSVPPGPADDADDADGREGD